MNENKDKRILQTCFHCGNKGMLDIKGEYETTWVDIDDCFDGFCHWLLVDCPVCKHASLIGMFTEPGMFDENGDQLFDEKILYPQINMPTEGTPEAIKSALESAIKIKEIDTTTCVMALRRVLELICKEKGANGKTLESKLKNLVKNNILPSGFDSACAVIRMLGNSAAHADKVVFYNHEVDELISLLQNIVMYLYALPIKIGKLKEKLEKLNKGKNDEF